MKNQVKNENNRSINFYFLENVYQNKNLATDNYRDNFKNNIVMFFF